MRGVLHRRLGKRAGDEEERGEGAGERNGDRGEGCGTVGIEIGEGVQEGMWVQVGNG